MIWERSITNPPIFEHVVNTEVVVNMAWPKPGTKENRMVW